MIDGGSSSKKTIGKDTIEPFLKSQRITRIDKVFLTHADADHTSGIQYLGESGEIRIKTLYLLWPAQGNDEYAEVAELADETVYLKAGDVVELKRGRVECLSPYRSDYVEENVDASLENARADISMNYGASMDMNEQSLVLMYREGDFSALLMGDAGKDSEEKLLRHISERRDHFPKNITVLKVGHHGSDTSTSEVLLDEVSPGIAILSYGMFNRYGHPSPDTVELIEDRGIRHVDTAVAGAISFELKGGRRLRMKTFVK